MPATSAVRERVDGDDIGEPGGVQAGGVPLARARKRFDVGLARRTEAFDGMAR